MLKIIAKVLLACFVILGCKAAAQEVQVGSHPLPDDVLKIMEKTRKAESLLEQQTSRQLTDLISPLQPSNNATAADYSPEMFHWIEEFPDKNTIKLQNNSEWTFDAYDARIVDSWKRNATVVISPTQSWRRDTNYEYVMTNRDTNQSIGVRLFDEPIAYGNETPWVGVVDWVNGRLYIRNNQGIETTWSVAPSDIYLLKEWDSGQSVVIGQNTSWLWLLSKHNHIIININMNHFIRAHPIESNQFKRADMHLEK